MSELCNYLVVFLRASRALPDSVLFRCRPQSKRFSHSSSSTVKLSPMVEFSSPFFLTLVREVPNFASRGQNLSSAVSASSRFYSVVAGPIFPLAHVVLARLNYLLIRSVSVTFTSTVLCFISRYRHQLIFLARVSRLAFRVSRSREFRIMFDFVSFSRARISLMRDRRGCWRDQMSRTVQFPVSHRFPLTNE